MCMQPGKHGLFQLGVVCAALSCFGRPPPSICSLVTFEFGDGMVVLPGSGVPSVWGYVLSERDRPFLECLGWSERQLPYRT